MSGEGVQDFEPAVEVRRAILEQRRDTLRAQAYQAAVEIQVYDAQPYKDLRISIQRGNQTVTIDPEEHLRGLSETMTNGYAAALRLQELIDALPGAVEQGL